MRLNGCRADERTRHGAEISQYSVASVVNDANYQPPFTFTGKLDKLTLKVDRPQLSPEDIKNLETAMRNSKVSE